MSDSSIFHCFWSACGSPAGVVDHTTCAIINIMTTLIFAIVSSLHVILSTRHLHVSPRVRGTCGNSHIPTPTHGATGKKLFSTTIEEVNRTCITTTCIPFLFCGAQRWKSRYRRDYRRVGSTLYVGVASYTLVSTRGCRSRYPSPIPNNGRATKTARAGLTPTISSSQNYCGSFN